MSTPSNPTWPSERHPGAPNLNDSPPATQWSSAGRPGPPPPTDPDHHGNPIYYPTPGPQRYPYPIYQPRPVNGLAIASMVLGIIWIYGIGSILALIFGYIARQQIRERGGSGAGMATAGIVLGWVGVGIPAAIAVVALVSSLVGAS